MTTRNGMISGSRFLYQSFLIALLLAGCTWRPSTYYLESPYSPPNPVSGIELAEPTCFDLNRIRLLIEKGGHWEDLPWRVFAPEQDRVEGMRKKYVDKLMNVFDIALAEPGCRRTKQAKQPASDAPLKEVLSERPDGVAAKKRLEQLGQSKLLEVTRYPAMSTAPWAVLLGQAIADHEGLLNITFEPSPTGRERRRAIFLKALGQPDTISISYPQPASLAISTRFREELSAPSNAFSRLPERAQAAIFSLAAEFATNWKDKTPDEAAGALLSALSRKGDESFSESQRLELTISAAINSAGVDDRLDYVGAYVVIPRFPKILSRGLHLEESFLTFVRRFAVAHRPNEREDWIPIDVNRAINQLTVRFEDIEKPQTIIAPLDLGTLQSTLGLTAEETATAAKHLAPTKIAPTLQEVRTDKLLKEIDRRSIWISPDRTMLRVTQRGHEAVTVAGTIAQNVTLHVPREDLLLLQLKKGEKDVAKDVGTPRKVPFASVSVQNMMQPLYAAIDGLGLIISTVRVASPTRYAFIKEPDGYAMTLVEGPIWLRLWERKFVTYRLTADDLFIGLRGTPKGKLAVMVKASGTTDFAQFASFEEASTFLSQIGKLIGLQKVKSSDSRVWLKIVSCADLKPGEWKAEINENDLTAADPRLGIEDFEGNHRGFEENEMKPPANARDLRIGCPV